ncbi:single myb histone 1 isoform X1 [Lactuca sativa]|uniref:single myb histone 1 isoform X1 n=2 Tax=Lactuca sativa TaxID=4236 RepID=UPI000CD903C8|nr:single myb histone 1 isoform X1 [Lactuca sativa]XP_023751852.1 single myb histone 1 isoform X1 [Lactuca sativa]
MGVPKQKWTSEEEAALKAGIAKYGPGKWSTILKDPEFSSVLHLRSNVDLKDKWRNMNCMGSSYGSRQRGSRSSKSQPIHKSEDISTSSKEEHDMQICIVDPLPTLTLPLQIDDSKKPIPIPMPRLDSLILDTIANLKESCGSSRAAIAEYIEENQPTPPNFGRQLKEELNALIDCGKLIKVKHRYRIAPSSYVKKSSKNEENCRVGETSGNKIITKAEIDAELEKMKMMTPQEAAAVAVKAVAEAEAAILEAERAEREAEVAEADAELAKGFAAAAMRALKKTAFWTW